MSVPRPARLIAGLIAIVIGGFVVAAPVAAATLPEGQQINASTS